MNDLLLLAGAGLLAGIMNGLAGGGTFVTLPALIAAGVPSVQANASSTVALFPGSIATAWTYYEKGQTICAVPVVRLMVVTLIGGLIGSLLLLWTPSSAFDLILPWLLLLATLAMAFGRRIGDALRGHFQARIGPLLVIHFALGIYAGYFGGAVGLMMVAIWLVLGEGEIKALNGPRTLLVTVANAVAVIVFIVARAVWWWPQTVVMLVGGLIGGYAGARIGRAIPPGVARALTLTFTIAITAVFFYRAYIRG